jgi:hypothetical protein
MKFQKTMALSTAAAAAAQVGQWFKRPDGSMTQYVGTRDAGGTVAQHFSDAGQKDGFAGRTQRFARARWHLAHRHGDVVDLVRRAPVSVDDARLGRFAREAVRKVG